MSISSAYVSCIPDQSVILEQAGEGTAHIGAWKLEKVGAPGQLASPIADLKHQDNAVSGRLFMISNRRIWLSVLLLILGVPAQGSDAKESARRPNIVFILADDLGFGDLSSYGATKIHTPHIDRLAREGIRFTDAHSPHSVCTPTRYALLTGRYAWRTWNGSMTVWPEDPLLISTSRLTLPKLLKSAGYRTAIIGKWHLGFGEPGAPGWNETTGLDLNGELKPGPLEVGFDYFFGIPHVGQEPHLLIENYRVVGLDPADPIRMILDDRWPRQRRSHFDRLGVPDHKFAGGEAAKYKHEDLAITLTERAVEWLERQSAEPFFLYFAHRNPHGPYTPHPRFKGTSQAGVYGDFVHELDWSVGEILAALERRGLTDRTIVVVSSDNGGSGKLWLSSRATVDGHRLNGPLFGQKTEAYEGGNRVPLIVKWPGVVKANSTSAALVALTDVLATVADMLHVDLAQEAGEDSFSFLHVLVGGQPSRPARDTLVMDSHTGVFAFREDAWKLILGPGGGGIYSFPEHSEFPGQLYDLSRDLGETRNEYGKHHALVACLRWRLKEIQYSGRSRPPLPDATPRCASFAARDTKSD